MVLYMATPYRTYGLKNDMVKIYKKNELQLQGLNAYTIKGSYFRVATWNVHGFIEFRDVYDYAQQFAKFLQITNPEVLVLLEYTPFGPTHLLNHYPYQYIYNGIGVFSKVPFSPVKNIDLGEGDRYLVHCNFSSWDLYASHLSPYSQTERLKAVGRIITYRKEHGHKNVIWLGDFNHVDVKEMTSGEEKEYISQHDARTGEKYVNIFDVVKERFWDSFEGSTPPSSTHWTGTRVDYIMVHKKSNIVPIRSSIYHTVLSDHLPVIMDIFENKLIHKRGP
jgi:endonuclease/exonuclease/phosphatase family metal-dependent hydrolase